MIKMIKEANVSQKWPIALFTIGVFMAGIDNGIISTALTTIYETFEVSPSWGAWTVTLYTLGVAISVPIVGKLSDNYGRKRLFIVEVALFGLGSLLVAFSPNFIVLLIARFIQAVGGGGIFIIGSSHVLATLPKEKQGKALGLLGGMHGLAAVVGPNLGAFILTLTGSWHWMFLINIPIAIFLIAFGLLKIEETTASQVKPLDFKGTMLLSLGILAFMYAITKIDSVALLNSVTKLSVLPFLIVGIGLLFVLIIHERTLERTGGDPIISYTLLTKSRFQMTLLLGLLSGGFLAGIIFIPSYVQHVLHVPAESAGFWLTPLAVASGIGAGLGGFLTDKYGAIRAVVYSGVVGSIGFLLFPYWVDGFSSFLIASILSGVGLGILLGAPLNVLAGESAEKAQYGSALGTLSLVRQIGLTLFPIIFASFITGGLHQAESVVQHVDDTQEVSIHLEKDQQSFTELLQQVKQVTDPDLRNLLYDLVTAAMETGYNLLFIVSGALSIFVLLIGLSLRLRKR
ncbi:MFS transporter [Virgibacillus sp. W0430]|uniref:MFS transporter n=1 Tax=Virgibacillus sp. W0430 TaxID=3391580 RepID=UPI003F47AB18